MVQAAFSEQAGPCRRDPRAVGVPWQSQGIASEAAREVVGWLEGRGVVTITAHIHPDHHASARVATRAGLGPTDEYRWHAGIRERPWRRRDIRVERRRASGNWQWPRKQNVSGRCCG
jgi:RimJ/RimL family protein N-acetyltransferase